MPICIKALLLVYLGNYYGRSIAAVPIAEEQLNSISYDDWVDFLENELPFDENILQALVSSQRQLEYFVDIIRQNELYNVELKNKKSAQLFHNILNGYSLQVKKYYQHL